MSQWSGTTRMRSPVATDEMHWASDLDLSLSILGGWFHFAHVIQRRRLRCPCTQRNSIDTIKLLVSYCYGYHCIWLSVGAITKKVSIRLTSSPFAHHLSSLPLTCFVDCNPLYSWPAFPIALANAPQTRPICRCGRGLLNNDGEDLLPYTASTHPH